MNERNLSKKLLSAVACLALAGTLLPTSDAQANSGETQDDKGERYVMKIDKPKSVKVGKEASYTVTISRTEPWHINQEFPTSLKVTPADGVTYPKVKLKKGDAEKFSEAEMVFKVPFTLAKKGSKDIESQLTFSICIESQCSRVKEKIKVAVRAK